MGKIKNNRQKIINHQKIANKNHIEEDEEENKTNPLESSKVEENEEETL
jgi:hypothetical protein